MCVRGALGLLTGSRNAADNAQRYRVAECRATESTLLPELLANVPHDDADSLNQYSFPFGTPDLRKAISAYYQRIYDLSVDPETEVTVTLGATEGMSVALRAAIGIGNGVVIMQPFHEMYVNQALVFGIKPLIVSLRHHRDQQMASDAWQLDLCELRRVIETADCPVKGLILNMPHNPTGKVFTEPELRAICDLCLEKNMWILTDEIYEHIIFGGRFHGRPGPHHTLLWSWGGRYRHSVIVANAISKTGSATGWRVGWVLSPPEITEDLRAIHDTMAMQAPTVLQYAAEALLQRPLDFFYRDLPDVYATKYQLVEKTLRDVGFDFASPEGAYYIFASYTRNPALAVLDSTRAAEYLIKNVGVAAVPGDAFVDAKCLPEGQTEQYLRFAFCKSDAVLRTAMQRLRKWKDNGYKPLPRDENGYIGDIHADAKK